MAFSLDPSQLISNALTSLVNSAIIVGMPTKESPVPRFLLCEITDERAHGLVKLPGIATQAGELKSRAVVGASMYSFTAVLSDFSDTQSGAFKAVQTALAAAATLAGSFASFGSILPNLAGLTTGYVSSQISTLTQIKNNMQPVLIMGAYFSLGVLQQSTPFLLSKWYLQDFDAPHMPGKGGCVLTLTLKEQFEPRDTSLLKGGLKALLGEIVSPLAGQVAGLVLP